MNTQLDKFYSINLLPSSGNVRGKLVGAYLSSWEWAHCNAPTLFCGLDASLKQVTGYIIDLHWAVRNCKCKKHLGDEPRYEIIIVDDEQGSSKWTEFTLKDALKTFYSQMRRAARERAMTAVQRQLGNLIFMLAPLQIMRNSSRNINVGLGTYEKRTTVNDWCILYHRLEEKIDFEQYIPF